MYIISSTSQPLFLLWCDVLDFRLSTKHCCCCHRDELQLQPKPRATKPTQPATNMFVCHVYMRFSLSFCLYACVCADIHIWSSTCVVWNRTSYQRWANRVIFSFIFFSKCFITLSFSSLVRPFLLCFSFSDTESAACQRVWQVLIHQSVIHSVWQSDYVFDLFLSLAYWGVLYFLLLLNLFQFKDCIQPHALGYRYK